MFGWFKRKNQVPEVLYFKSNEAAFEYASQYMQRPLVTNSIIFGLVISDIKPGSSQQKWRVKLATERGVIESENCGSIANDLAKDLNAESSPVQSGDLVAVQVGAYDPSYPISSPMQYFIIMCKLKPEVRMEAHVFSSDIPANKASKTDS